MNMRIPLCWYTVSFASFFLGACGGGSDKDNAFGVDSTSPEPGAVDVEPDTVVTISFNKDTLGSSVNESNILLEDSQGVVSGTVAFDSLSNSSTFTPDQKLALLRDYAVTVKRGVTSLSGNVMSTDYTFAFTTRDGVWKDIEEIVKDDQHATRYNDSQVVIDHSGNAFAIWSEHGSGIHVSRYTTDNGWSSKSLISPVNADTISPDIAIDNEGNAIAVWQQSVDLINPPGGGTTRGNIWANRYTPATG